MHQQRRRWPSEHVRRRERPRVAVHVRRAPAATGRHDAAHLPGQRPARPEAAAAGLLLRERDHHPGHRRQGPGHRVGGAGLRGRPDQWRRPPNGRRARALGDRLLGDERRQAAGRHPAGDGAEGVQLARHADVRRGFRVGEAARDAPRVGGARRDRLPHGWPRRRRAHTRVCGGCCSQRLPAPAICHHLVRKPPVDRMHYRA
ncbi:hypothetical protein VPH35_055076 [Triticum aestivum]